MLGCQIETEKIDRLMEKDLHKIAKGLMNYKMHVLKPIPDNYKNNEHEILKKFLSLQSGALLNSYDTKVLIGLFKLWLNKGKKSQIQFEFKELAEAMAIKPSGGEYRLIYESLKNIAATWIEYKEYFDPARSKFYSATVQHRPIKSLAWIARTKEEEGGRERAAVVTFHEILHESLLVGNYVFINMVIYNELPTSYARLIYLNILDAIFGITSFELDRLNDHITFPDESFNRARAIRMIETSFGHLLDADVITDFSLRKTGRKHTHIDFVPSDWLQGHKNAVVANEHASMFPLEASGQLVLFDG